MFKKTTFLWQKYVSTSLYPPLTYAPSLNFFNNIPTCRESNEQNFYLTVAKDLQTLHSTPSLSTDSCVLFYTARKTPAGRHTSAGISAESYNKSFAFCLCFLPIFPNVFLLHDPAFRVERGPALNRCRGMLRQLSAVFTLSVILAFMSSLQCPISPG